MKPINGEARCPSGELVLAVNEIFHDLEGSEYSDRHPEIFDIESKRWDVTAAALSKALGHPMRVLDIGSGTGFVPMHVGPYLTEGDLLVCSDLSSTMLDVCRKNVEATGTKARLEFLKLDGGPLRWEGERFNLITMNSVLHHIPDIEIFLDNIDALLAAKGFLIIGHEPNQLHHKSRLIREISIYLNNGGMRGILLRMASRMGLKRKPSGSPASSDTHGNEHAAYDGLLAKLNERLLADGLIDRAMTMPEVWSITDIHDSTGFDPATLLSKFGNHYRLDRLETYRHLGWQSTATRESRFWNHVLSFLRPRHGATFFATFRRL